VDDIKIFAKTEGELRKKLIALDLASKEIGLFPQTSKINIRRITTPDEEIKSISRPPEPSITPFVRQDLLIKRLLEITRLGRINKAQSTRFKFLLSKAEPSHRLNVRLISVLRNHPEYSETISNYIIRYARLPKKFSGEIISYLKDHELYHSVNGNLLRACLGRIPTSNEFQLSTFCADRLLRPKKHLLIPQPTYKEALIAWSIRTRMVNYAELIALQKTEGDWWVRKSILRELTEDQFGKASFGEFLNISMRFSESETSQIAAARLIETSTTLVRPYGDIHESGKIILKAAKVIKSAGDPPSRINGCLSYILGRPETPYNWKRFFGTQHRQIELMTILLKQSRESDIDAFLTRLDSFSDGLVKEIFRRYCTGKTYPKYGAAIKHPILLANLPKLMNVLTILHDLRLQSITAHPRSQKTGKGTRRLRHYDFYKIRPFLLAGFSELESSVTP
jgi:hypothetical protein